MDANSKPTLVRSRERLVEAGYRVLFREAPWAECLVACGAERWHGVGESADDALEHVLAQMFPSALARMLLDRHVAASPASVEVATAADPPTAPHPSDEGAERSEAHASAAVEAAPGAGTPGPAEPESGRPAAPEVAGAAAPQPWPCAALKPAPAATLPAAPTQAPSITSAEALAAISGVLEEIERALPRLARLAPDRQRQEMLVWICRARAIEEKLPPARDVTTAVARVARRLTELAKTLWPGTIRALQLSTRPEDTVDPRAHRDSLPRTWRKASEIAQARLDEQHTGAAAAGLDEDGWADAPVLRAPPPADPAAFLNDIIAELTGQLGALETPADDVRLPDALDADALVRATQKLRWVRGHLGDHTRWAFAMGRIRRASLKLGDARLTEVLDSRYRPAAPWARIVGGRTAAEERAAATGELRAALAQAAGDRNALLDWLVRAIEVFATPELAELLHPVRDQVLAVADAAANHDDRRVRRRLRDLAARLVETSPEAPACVSDEPPPSAMTVREVDGAGERGLQALGEQVRPHTQGRRVLFVSNRNDPELEAKLADLLGMRITFCDGSLRRVQAQCERIAQRSYDLVLSATGFQLHGVDGALSRAASAANTPYVRVNRGRPLACMQAIAREFGLGSAVVDGGQKEAASGR